MTISWPKMKSIVRVLKKAGFCVDFGSAGHALFGFCHRAAYAALVSAIVWIFMFLPLPEGGYPDGMTVRVIRLLDLPIAVATQIMPCDEFAVDLWFSVRGGGGCPEPIGDLRTYFFNHMRIGVPSYLLLFYLPNIGGSTVGAGAGRSLLGLCRPDRPGATATRSLRRGRSVFLPNLPAATLQSPWHCPAPRFSSR